jgi:hypothetical protein
LLGDGTARSASIVICRLIPVIMSRLTARQASPAQANAT